MGTLPGGSESSGSTGAEVFGGVEGSTPPGFDGGASRIRCLRDLKLDLKDLEG